MADIDFKSASERASDPGQWYCYGCGSWLAYSAATHVCPGQGLPVTAAMPASVDAAGGFYMDKNVTVARDIAQIQADIASIKRYLADVKRYLADMYFAQL